MIAVEVPLEANIDAQELDIELSGQSWHMLVAWNARAQAYALTLENSEGEAVISGLLLRTGADALEGCKARIGVAAVLTVEDLTGKGEEAEQGGLGGRWRLVWAA